MVKEVVESLKEPLDDSTVPRNIRSRIQEIINTLDSDTETSIKINKALNDLEEIGEDTNIQTYTRTQIWNAISILEKV